MIKILVTGGAGFIGSNLVDRLIRENYAVTVIDDLSSGNIKNVNKKARFFKLDVRNLKKILPLFQGVDYIFHLAALPRIQRSVEKPLLTHQVNTEGTLNVLIASLQNNIKKVVYASSSSVYGDVSKQPFRETIMPHPLSPYAVQKLTGEYYCKIFYEIYGLKTVSLRFFSIYGPRMNGREAYATVVSKFLILKREGKPLVIYGDGTQSRDFTFVSDAVTAAVLTMKSGKTGKGETLNICFGKKTTISQLAKKVGGKIVYRQARKGEPKNVLGSNSLAKKLLLWKPENDLDNGLKKLEEYYR